MPVRERSDRLLTVEEVAQFLHVSSVTVYRLASRGQLPATKVGKLWRFQREEIEACVAGSSSQPKRNRSDQSPAGRPNDPDDPGEATPHE